MRHLPTLKINVLPFILEYAGIACKMMACLNDTFGCRLGCGVMYALRRALDFEVEGQRKKGSLLRQTGEESVKVSLRREDALCRSKWSVGVDPIAAWLR